MCPMFCSWNLGLSQNNTTIMTHIRVQKRQQQTTTASNNNNNNNNSRCSIGKTNIRSVVLVLLVWWITVGCRWCRWLILMRDVEDIYTNLIIVFFIITSIVVVVVVATTTATKKEISSAVDDDDDEESAKVYLQATASDTQS